MYEIASVTNSQHYRIINFDSGIRVFAFDVRCSCTERKASNGLSENKKVICETIKVLLTTHNILTQYGFIYVHMCMRNGVYGFFPPYDLHVLT